MPFTMEETAYYVAPDGDDGAPGTLEQPFASLERARDALRDARDADGERHVPATVWLRGGIHRRSEPFVLEPEDSGAPCAPVVYAAYPGEEPHVSGGVPVAGWTEEAPGRWRVRVTDGAGTPIRVRQLWKDAERMPRARFPQKGQMLWTTGVSADVREIELDGPFGSEDLAGKGAEFVIYQHWALSRMPVVSSKDRRLRFENPVGWIGHGDATTATPGKAAFIENAPEFLTEPGEWVQDPATGTITYLAEEEESPEEAGIIRPVAERLLVFRGEPGNPVEHVQFRGVSFVHTDWLPPAYGYIGTQAAHFGRTMEEPVGIPPGAIEITHACDCAFEDCRIAHAGANGIALGAGTARNAIAHCEIEDIAANGVMVGWRGLGELEQGVGNRSLDADWPDPADAPVGNRVTRCALRGCGAVYHGAVALFDAFSIGTRFDHNLVAHMPYTGISIGFRWSEDPTSQRQCTVAHNHIHDVMREVADGGGIYTLGWQPGTVLLGNHIHDVHRSAFTSGNAPNNGIFFDQGSSGYYVADNTIYRTSGAAIRFNQTEAGKMLWGENDFRDAQDGDE